MNNPVYTIIGGVYGVGKSSFLGALKCCTTDLGIIIDDQTVICDLVKKCMCFTQETLLSDQHTIATARQTKEKGYYVRLYYVGLDTIDESRLRIANRVARGGKNVAGEEVERCFANRWSALKGILPYCDEAAFYDNGNGFTQVATYRNGEIILEGDYLPKWVLEVRELFAQDD